MTPWPDYVTFKHLEQVCMVQRNSSADKNILVFHYIIENKMHQ